MYRTIEKKPFRMDHCFEELRHHRKWNIEIEKKNEKTKVSTVCPNSTNRNPSTLVTNLDEAEVVKGNNELRPNGRKKDKELRKWKGNEIESEFDSKFTQILQKFIEEKNKGRDRRFSMDEFKEDERIMLIDTEGMDEMTKEFYNNKKMEIVAKKKSMRAIYSIPCQYSIRPYKQNLALDAWSCCSARCRSVYLNDGSPRVSSLALPKACLYYQFFVFLLYQDRKEEAAVILKKLYPPHEVEAEVEVLRLLVKAVIAEEGSIGTGNIFTKIKNAWSNIVVRR
ncbi:hypothetical protein GIB67_010238 [Kingdonia uniflora]|uniref:No apical meristem-associated C-terminal domain-containing protein n=1 Tax=Kingdonia uniflora TaxID=39325 RepID=A0A7J7NBP0_9MAGN|nr:hypothetical protein GIB67_010238 [Kingdonia uniflora]